MPSTGQALGPVCCSTLRQQQHHHQRAEACPHKTHRLGCNQEKSKQRTSKRGSKPTQTFNSQSHSHQTHTLTHRITAQLFSHSTRPEPASATRPHKLTWPDGMPSMGRRLVEKGPEAHGITRHHCSPCSLSRYPLQTKGCTPPLPPSTT